MNIVILSVRLAFPYHYQRQNNATFDVARAKVQVQVQLDQTTVKCTGEEGHNALEMHMHSQMNHELQCDCYKVGCCLGYRTDYEFKCKCVPDSKTNDFACAWLNAEGADIA